MDAAKLMYDLEADNSARPLIDKHWRSQKNYSKGEFMDELARRIGRHYGLSDIRDANDK